MSGFGLKRSSTSLGLSDSNDTEQLKSWIQSNKFSQTKSECCHVKCKQQPGDPVQIAAGLIFKFTDLHVLNEVNVSSYM